MRVEDFVKERFESENAPSALIVFVGQREECVPIGITPYKMLMMRFILGGVVTRIMCIGVNHGM